MNITAHGRLGGGAGAIAGWGEKVNGTDAFVWVLWWLLRAHPRIFAASVVIIVLQVRARESWTTRVLNSYCRDGHPAYQLWPWPDSHDIAGSRRVGCAFANVTVLNDGSTTTCATASELVWFPSVFMLRVRFIGTSYPLDRRGVPCSVSLSFVQKRPHSILATCPCRETTQFHQQCSVSGPLFIFFSHAVWFDCMLLPGATGALFLLADTRRPS